jgi:hypothetical protein
MEHTVIAISADHGEAFFEHGVMAHGTTLYEEMIHVPLVLWLPGRKAQLVAEPVSLLDLAPTLLATLGCGFSTATEGQSLLRDGVVGAWDEPVVVRQYDSSEHGEGFVRRVIARSGSHKLILDLQTEVEELYDLSTDAAETTNLIEERAAQREDLMEAIFAARRLVGAVAAERARGGKAADLPSLASAIEGGDAAAIVLAQDAVRRQRKVSPEALAVLRALGRAGQRGVAALDELSVESLPERLHDAVVLARSEGGGVTGPLRALALALSDGRDPASRLDAIELLHDSPYLATPTLVQLSTRSSELSLAVAAALVLCEREGEAARAGRLLRRRLVAPKMLESIDHQRARRAILCLGAAAGADNARYLVTLYESDVSKKLHLAYENLAALGRTGSDPALEVLVGESKLAYEPIREAALDAIATLGTPGALAYLRSLALTNKHLRQVPQRFAARLLSVARQTPVELPSRHGDLRAAIAAAMEAEEGSAPLILLRLAPSQDRQRVLVDGHELVEVAPSGDEAGAPVFIDGSTIHESLRIESSAGTVHPALSVSLVRL